jgi:hypothetical protein
MTSVLLIPFSVMNLVVVSEDQCWHYEWQVSNNLDLLNSMINSDQRLFSVCIYLVCFLNLCLDRNCFHRHKKVLGNITCSLILSYLVEK